MYKNNFIIKLLIIIIISSCTVKKRSFNGSQADLILKKKQDSLAFELCQIYGLDQGIRLSEGFPNKAKLSQNIDTFNFKKVVAFIKKNGYPTEKMLGKSNLSHECVEGALTAVLLHNPHRIVNENEYFEFFLAEVKKGNIKPSFFADILDKYYWTKSKNKENRRVFYGSQFGKPCIQTKEATNKARVEIGLAILKDNEFVDCGAEILDMPKERR